MKFTIRKVLFASLLMAVLGLALLLSSRKAEAQFQGGLYGSYLLSIPTSLTNGAAYTPASPLDIYVPNGKNAAIQLTAGGSNTMSSAVTAVFARSLDGSTVDNVNPLTLAITMANTGTKTVSTNFQVDAGGHLMFLYITNANADFVTNAYLRVALKPGY